MSSCRREVQHSTGTCFETNHNRLFFFSPAFFFFVFFFSTQESAELRRAITVLEGTGVLVLIT